MLWEKVTVSPRVGGETKSWMGKAVAGPETWMEKATVPPGTVDLEPGLMRRSHARAIGTTDAMTARVIVAIKRALRNLFPLLKSKTHLT